MTKLNIVAASVMMAVTGSALAVPAVSDYDEATAAYQDAYVEGLFNLDSGNQDQTSYNLDLFLDYEQVFSSSDLDTTINFDGEASRDRGPDAGNEDKSYYLAEGLVSADKYFAPDRNLNFYYGKAEVGLKKGQEDPRTQVTIGLGYGRVVNVTPMARAIRIIEALRLRGSLTGDPSDAVYQEVAVVIDKEAEYSTRYGQEDYEQYWIADIENALKGSGMVAGGGDLGAGAILKAYDVLDRETIQTRKKGWEVRAGVGVLFTNYDGENGKPLLEAIAEYHYPIGNSTQFSNVASVGATLDDGDNSYFFENDMSLTYELTDLIDWRNGWTFTHLETDADGFEDITTHTISSGFYYYLTNQLNLGLTATLVDLEDNVNYSINGLRNDGWERNLNLSIRYRLK
ncbi:DUF481 domain-containing protein [Psychromonas sp.]|uniref:DUF481 domain-containing protein n=1 Tax=Psychromonas sp. TaxID=1884585 RepID=UPI003566BB6A